MNHRSGMTSHSKPLRILLLAAVLLAGSLYMTEAAHAASGTVYDCTIHPCYRHPVTGQIEDSGGESAYTTGQGMVEGCLSTVGLMEVTDDGHYYLTFRLGLMDYTSQHSFQVQKWGESGWTDPAIGVTNQGTDSNGTTSDICVEVPDTNCVVRGTMYVEPMGRSVVFYFYPSDFAEGNSNGMLATMVTEPSSGSAGISQGDASQQTPQQTETAPASDQTAQQNAQSEGASGDTVGGTITRAQGLSLSTALQSAEDQQVPMSKGVKRFLIDLAAFLTAGILLIGALAIWLRSKHLGVTLVHKGSGDFEDDEYIYEDEE